MIHALIVRAECLISCRYASTRTDKNQNPHKNAAAQTNAAAPLLWQAQIHPCQISTNAHTPQLAFPALPHKIKLIGQLSANRRANHVSQPKNPESYPKARSRQPMQSPANTKASWF